jgi:PAS domain S-box-containing protein
MPIEGSMAMARLGIKFKTAFGITVAMLAIFATFVTVQSSNLRSNVLEQVGTQQLSLIRVIVEDIDKSILSHQRVLSRVATTLPAARIADNPAMLSFLEQQSALLEMFDNLAVLRADGEVSAGMPNRGIVGKKFGQREYFKRTGLTMQSLVSEPFIAQPINQPAIVMTAPIFDPQRRMVGMLIGTVHLLKPNFLGRLGTASIGKTGRFALVGRDRSLIITRDRERMLTQGPAPGKSDFFDRAVAGDDGWIEATNSRGEHGMYSYTALSSVPWVLVGIVPAAEAFAPLVAARRSTLHMSAVVLVLLPLLVWLFVNRLFGPLTALHEGIRALRRNPGSNAALPVEHADEIGELAVDFNALLAERGAATEALAESQERLHLIADHMPVLIGYMDLEERYRFVNRTFAQWYGRAESDYIGKTLQEMVGATAYADLGPHLKRALAGEEVHYQREMRETDRERSVDGSYVPHIGPDGRVKGVFVLVSDVTERVRAAEQVEATAGMLRRTVENMPMGVSVMDADLKLIAFNDRFLELLDFPKDRFSFGDPLEKFFRHNAARGEYGDGDSEKQVQDRLALVRRCEPHSFERVRADGVVIEVRGTPVPGGGFVSVYSDVTARREESRRLIEARENAESTARAKSEFLATMSHEVRTPMNGVLGIADLLLDTDLTPDQRDYAETIQRSGQALLEILNDILDLSKIEAGKLELEQLPFNPRATLNDVLALTAPRASAKGLLLDADIAADIPTDLQGDPGRLRQVLFNLIGNSVKFTDAGSVRVCASVASEDAGGVTLRFRIVDTGIGMTPEQRQRLFQPFSQADASTTRRFGGTGLGLAICLKLVEMMGGAFEVDTAAGAGSTFTFTMHCRRAAPGASQVAAEQARTVRHYVGRVLVVEDNIVNRKVARATLKGFGLTVLEAENGALAIDILHREAMDLVLMDVHMPEMDGLEATRRIRAAESGGILAGHRPIVAMTANVMRESVDACRAAGMDDFLPKPFERRQMVDMLSRWLPNQASHAAPVALHAEPTLAIDPPAQPTPIDAALYQRLADTMEDDLPVLMQDFLETTARMLETLQPPADAAAGKVIARHAHTLKSSAALVGAMSLSAMARSLEAAADQGDFSGLATAAEDLQAEFTRVRAALEQLATPEPHHG